MRHVLDAGALIALDRNDSTQWQRLESAGRDGIPLVTHGGVVAQVVYGGRRARLGQALASIDVLALDRALGDATGHLLARSKTSDIVDAALVVLSRDGDTIYTSDPDDIERLVAASGTDITIVPV